MLPHFLVPEKTVHENGESEPMTLAAHRGALLLTLGITQVIEQESLLVQIQSSKDATEWNPASIAVFPQKFYPGMSSIVLETSMLAEVAAIRAQWKVNRWGRGSKTPAFRFYLFAEALPVTRD